MIASPRNRLAWLIGGLLLPLLGPFAKPAYALTPGAVSITMTTDPLLVSDSNSCSGGAGPHAAYVGFRVTNTSGSTLTNLQANLSGFVTGFGLAGGQAATQYVGTLAAGASRTVYSYISYPCHTSTPVSDTLTLTVSDASLGVVIGTGTVTATSMISANAGGLVTSYTLGPGAVVGQIIPYDVTYSFGNVQANDRFNLQPAGNTSFNAGCFQLVTSEITASQVPGLTVGTKDKLFYTATSTKGGSGNLVTVRYYLLYLCGGVNTTANPYAAQTSGSTNVKYTGNFGATPTTFPSASNPFTITKSASTTTLPTGGTVTYTVTITNTSGFDSIIDRITDVLPAGVTYGGLATGSQVTAANSSSLPATGATGTLNWVGIPFTSYSVPAGGSIKLVYTANVTSTPGSYKNSVTATSGQSTTAPATATVSVGSADIVTTKSGAATVTAGGSITYTITTKNNGPTAATDVVIQDTLPTGVTFNSASDNGTVANGVVTWPAIANLASGANVTRTVTVTAPASGGPLVNKASSTSATTDPTPANNDGSQTAAQVSTTITPSADLSITKTDGQTTATPGNPITYTITVTNNGPSTVNSVTVTDAVPSSILNPTFTPNTGTYNSSTGAWTGLNLAPGQSVALTLTGTVSPTATGTLSNTATVAAPSGTTDSNTNNNSSTDTDTLTSTADLSITKTDAKTSITPGSATSYTITVTNNGPSTVNSVTVTDTIPSTIQNPAFTPSSGTYNSSTGAWTGLNLASGQSATLTLSGTVSSTATGTITNTATVAAPTGVTDPTSSNNSSTDTTTVTPTADLSITKTDRQTSATPGSAITYTITVTNNGPSTVNSVTVKDNVPSSILNPKFTPSSGTYDSSTGAWTGFNLTSGQSITLTLSGTVSATATGNLTNTATVDPPSGVTDSNTNNNSSTDTDTITPTADLSITKTAPNLVIVGNNLTYTLTVTNKGSSNATGVIVTDKLPSGVTFVLATPIGSCSQLVGTVTCNLGNLASGATDTIEIIVLPTTAGTLTNTANVKGNEPDPVTANNTSTVTTNLTADNPSQLLLVKRITAITPANGTSTTSFVDDPGTTDDNASNWPSGYLKGLTDGGAVKPGDTVEYTIYFLSNGGRSIQNLNMCDLVPTNTTFLPDAYGNGSGIAKATGSAAPVNLTNTGTDTDGGRFVAAGSSQGVSCSATNPNGAVVINLGDIPNATAQGTPTNSYGFIRFRVRVN